MGFQFVQSLPILSMGGIHQKIHSEFKINGISFVRSELITKSKSSLNKNKALFSFLLEWLNDSSQIELQTSGSTGKSKRIKVNKKSMIVSAQNTAKYFNLKPGESALLCLPITFIAGKMMVVRAIVLGLDLYVTKPSGSPVNELSKSFDFIAMTPFQLEKTINHIHKIKCLLVGGSPVSESLREKIVNKTSGVFETYGMTETVSHVAIKNLSLGENSFKSIPGITFSNNMGCLEINAPFISKLPVLTNDKVELISDTRFKWIGRNSLIINSGGIKFNPEKLEKTLSNCYSQPFIISSLPDSLLGEKIVIVFENKIPFNFNQSFDKLKKHERPREVFYLENFSRINGKINRKIIKNKILNKFKDGN